MPKLVKITPFVALLCLYLGTVEARTLKIATLAPAGTTWMKSMQAGATSIKEKTAGRVKLKFYPGGVMGNDQSVHRKIKIGQLHGGAFTSGGLSQISSSVQALGLPMIFDNYEEVDFVREKIEPQIRADMERGGFVILGISDGGFARILSKAAMRDLPTLRASKVWIPDGDELSNLTFEALGISPISLPISDVFTGLQTGLIETVAVNPIGAIAFQWHSNTTHMTDIPITYLIGLLAVQLKAFEKISPADQKIVRAEMAIIFKELDKLNRDDDQQAQSALVQQGIQFVTPKPGELEEWKALSNSAIDKMVETGVISADIVGQVRTHLTDFRNKP
jgi:TRAP-type C4-dicarboxylate transport system substrate-binding protein